MKQDLTLAKYHSGAYVSLQQKMPEMLARLDAEGSHFLRGLIHHFDANRPPLACCESLGVAEHPLIVAELGSR
eukprot:4984127-Alexandrium_andersonii.AAC.1